MPVSYTVAGPATLSGTTLTVTGGGTVVVAANQAGNGTYSPAPQVTANLVVNPSSQTVTFNSIPDQTAGTSLDLSSYVSASSGLPISSYSPYNSSGICTVSGSTVTFLAPGSCVIIALQDGNNDYTIAGAGQTIHVD